MSEVEPTRKRLEWASDIPPDWDVVNLRMLARIFAGGTPDRKNTDYWTDGTVPWLNSESVNDWAIWTPSELISGAALANGATRWAPKGSVLVALAGQGKTKGMAARLEIDSTLNQSLAAIVPGPSLEYRFLQYWLTSNYGNIRGLAGGDLRDGLNLQHIGSIQVPRPPVEEQRAIADYLDRETAQIDAFIAKNEELITLLTERRAAVIELAIREGAGATAKLGVLLRGLKDGTHGSFARIESPHPLLGARNVQGGRLVLDGKESTISEDDHRAIVANGFPRRGDVLLVIVGATIGKSAVYELTDSLSFQRSVAFLRPGRLLTSRFLWYYTQTRAFQDEVWLRAKVSAQPGLYLGDVASIPIALPDVAAQQGITTRLDRDVVAIDEAISVATTTIELARERRAALISAAVTGKIDVGVAV